MTRPFKLAESWGSVDVVMNSTNVVDKKARAAVFGKKTIEKADLGC